METRIELDKEHIEKQYKIIKALLSEMMDQNCESEYIGEFNYQELLKSFGLLKKRKVQLEMTYINEVEVWSTSEDDAILQAQQNTELHTIEGNVDLNNCNYKIIEN